MLLEIIATTVGDAIAAQQGGADRIELITGILEGGLTPSLALVERVREAVSIPVRVMVRPHARSFIYDDEDIATMRQDIAHIRAVGGLGIVMGMLKPDRTVDEEKLKILLEAAGELEVTFHRAFDEARSQTEALDDLVRYPGITDILTSGGCKSAIEGAQTLAKLNRMAAGQSASILAGAGLHLNNLPGFLRQSDVRRVHLGSAVRENSNPLKPVDPERVQAVRVLLNSGGR